MPRPILIASRALREYCREILFLVAVWSAAFQLRQILAASGQLTRVRHDALTSLLYVIPLMLVGWAAIALFERGRRK